MNYRRNTLSLCFALLVSGCGGGGGVESTPPPPPSPPPPPPPPPGPTYSSFPTLTAPATVPLTGVSGTFALYTLANSTTQTPILWGRKTYAEGNLSLAYDPATKTYTVSDGREAVKFSPGDLKHNYTFRGDQFQNYVKSNVPGSTPDTTRSENLTVYRLDGGGDTRKVILMYTTLADWGVSETKNNETNIAKFIAVGGFETQSTDMPKSGVATYDGLAIADYEITRPIRSMEGQFRVVADFAKSSLDVDLLFNPSGESPVSLNGSAVIAANSNRFDGSLSGGGFSGFMEGAFFGPKAKEVGLSFSVSDSSGATINGAAAGVQ